MFNLINNRKERNNNMMTTTFSVCVLHHHNLQITTITIPSNNASERD